MEDVVQLLDEAAETAEVDAKETVEGGVEVGDDVAEERDGDDGEETHGQLGAVGGTLHEQHAEKGEVAEGLQEGPPARQGQRGGGRGGDGEGRFVARS